MPATGVSTILIVTAIGSLAQVIDGSLGMGFGVFSSSLMITFGFAPAMAVAVVNASKIFTGLASGLSHWRMGNVRRDWLLPLVLGGVSGGFLGGYLLTSVPSETAKPWVSALLLVMGLLIIWRTVRWRFSSTTLKKAEKCQTCPKGVPLDQPENIVKRGMFKLGALGFLAAFINGLSGAYGPVATSGVLLLEKGQPRHAVGTVNMAEFFVATTVATTILVRQGLGQFPLGLMLALSLGGILVAPLAAYICRRFPSRGLAFLMGLSLIALNLKAVILILR